MGVFTETPPTFRIGRLAAAKMVTIGNFITAVCGAWTPYTPAVTNITVGSGSLTGRYRLLGKTLDLRVKFVYGAGSAVGSDPTFSIPSGLTLNSTYSVPDIVGECMLLDSGVASRKGGIDVSSTSVLRFVQFSAEVTTSITAASPWVWGASDSLSATLRGLEVV